MTSAIIKHKCVEQAYARSPWSEIKELAGSVGTYVTPEGITLG